jgi:hypothetical protein
MKYCYIENNQIKQTLDVLPTNWRNISNFYILPNSELKKHGWLPVEEVEYNGTLPEGFHIQQDKVLQVITRSSPQQIDSQQQIEDQWAGVRYRRDELLLESDKFVLFDVYEKFSNEKQQEIKDYRQQLRDIPQNSEGPDNIIWPNKPWV